MSGCGIGGVQNCTGVSAPRVLDLVRVEQPAIISIEEKDLLELFVSYGNEELWGVPPDYFLEVNAELVRGGAADPAEDEEEDGQGASAGATSR